MNLAECNLVGALLDGLPLAVVITDLDDRIRVFNPAAETIFGWPTADAVGRSYLELWASPGDGRSLLIQLHQQGLPLSGGPSLVSLRRRTGEEVVGMLTVASLSDSLGDSVGLLSIFEDRSEENARARQLAEVVDQLWEAEQRVAGLARMSAAIHAISQPLTAAMGLTELLQGQVPAGEAQERLDKLAHQLERIRAGLGDVSRLLHAPPSTARRYA